MSNVNKNCYNEEHSTIAAICYCVVSKIYMCNKCENLHSKLFKYHNKYGLDKNISDIFTGFCKEKNHLDKLEFFCKTHNQLCCSGCISKIRAKDKGNHKDCDVCLNEEIVEGKKNNLNENILKLESLSNNIGELIKELKTIFEKINKDKEELKLEIQKIFTKIRNSLNEREDEILLEVDSIFDNTYMKENEVKEMEKIPNKIKVLLDKGKVTVEDWEDKNKLGLLINNCVDIENNILNINKMESNIKKCKIEMESLIKFNQDKEDELNKLILNFGKVYKEKINDPKKIECNFQNSNFDFEIKTNKKEFYGMSLSLHSFLDREYNKLLSK